MEKTVTIDIIVPSASIKRMQGYIDKSCAGSFGALLVEAMADDFSRWGMGNHFRFTSVVESDFSVGGAAFCKISITFPAETAGIIGVIQRTNPNNQWVHDIMNSYLAVVSRRPDGILLSTLASQALH